MASSDTNDVGARVFSYVGQVKDGQAALRQTNAVGVAFDGSGTGVPAAQKGTSFDTKTLRMIGFKALLAWHYLVLFSPLFFGAMQETSEFLFKRQLALYLSLGVTFGVLALVGRPLLRRSKSLGPSRIAIVSVGVISTLATVFSLLVPAGVESLQILVTVLLGASEAMFMFLWLHYYRKIGANHLHRSFGFDMMCGAAIAFIVCSLVEPASYITSVCLPVIATVSLVINWRSAEEQPLVDEGAVSSARLWKHLGKGSRQSMLRQIVKTLVPVVMYSFVFGLVQGGYLVDDVTLLMANDSVVLLGVVVAGLVICLIPERRESDADIDLMHRFSLIFFVCGVVGVPLLGSQLGTLVIAEAAILAGFNLFDFGTLILGIGLARRMQPDRRQPIDGARPLVYFGLALGLVAGTAVVSLAGGASYDLAFLSICGIAITMLVVTVVMPLREREGCRYFSACTLLDRGIDPNDLYIEEGAAEELAAYREASKNTAGLNRKDIDALVDVVRRAQEGSALPCLESAEHSCPLSDGSLQQTLEQQASHQEYYCPKCGVVMNAAGEVQESSAAGGVLQGDDGEVQTAQISLESSSVAQIADSQEYARAKRDAQAESKRHDSPWRRTCREIAKLYRLSPRETEIFFLVAKGRNADYVQQKLVISTHTAKTHIANIYHKLGVHSSQEVLNLVEAFREEDIKARESVEK